MNALASARTLHLEAGPLRCFFETETGFLRAIRAGDVEVVRAIYGAVRDHNWDTILPAITVERLERAPDRFLLRFTARCDRGDVRYRWVGTVAGAGGELWFGFEGEAESDFRRNRIGLCVLHPIRECAGHPVRHAGPDGEWHDASFPASISPHQPFFDLQAFAWEPVEGLRAGLTFEGDRFEMEDQRNWTDASFKTYCTPLSLPFPMEVNAGDRVSQRVTLRVDGAGQEAAAASAKPEFFPDLTSGSADPKPLPSLGFVMDPAEVHTDEVLARLAVLRPGHLRISLDLGSDRWPVAWREARRVAERLGTGLQVTLLAAADDRRALEKFRAAARDAHPVVRTVLVFDRTRRVTTAPLLEQARQALAPLSLTVGTDAYFAELNRQRPPRGWPAAYSFNPQVHAFDDLSVMETLEAQPATAESAERFCDGPFHVGPISLRPRFNPNATGPDAGAPGELPATVDPRQRRAFTAAWTVGTLANFVHRASTASLTFFETVGPKGLFTGPHPPPPAFGAGAHEVFPVYHVFKALAGASAVLGTGVRAGSACVHYVVDGGERRALLANLSPEPQTVAIALPAGESVCAMVGDTPDGDDGEGAATDPRPAPAPGARRPGGRGRSDLLLAPYGVALLRLP